MSFSEGFGAGLGIVTGIIVGTGLIMNSQDIFNKSKHNQQNGSDRI